MIILCCFLLLLSSLLDTEINKYFATCLTSFTWNRQRQEWKEGRKLMPQFAS